MASLTTGFCIFALLLPFVFAKRDLWGILSPEVMGGLGYLIFIGFAALTNYAWPGYAVNPSLFNYLPLGIIAQTIAALAFFVGAMVTRHAGIGHPSHETHQGRLTVVICLYAFFALYVSVLMPREDPEKLLKMTRAGASISWILTTGPYIIWQSLPMVVAAQIYLKQPRFLLLRYGIVAIFGFLILFFITSGSRTYAVQTVLLLFVAHTIAQRRFSRIAAQLIIGISVLILVLNTIWRLSGPVMPSVSPSTTNFDQIVERLGTTVSESNTLGSEDITENFQVNVVYHLSDNQTMAMIIKNYGKGELMGRASFNSLLSGLPNQMRPVDYESAVNSIIRQFQFYKERAVDAPFWPDWQMTIGVLGFADFGLLGLLLFPFVTGVALRWIYNRTVLTTGLGQAGWLLYIPLVQVLWTPHGLGPDSTQTLRLLIPLAIALRWTTKSPLPQSEVLPEIVPSQSKQMFHGSESGTNVNGTI
ncbi:MAG: hypothetical protein HZC40_00050 [Chloroflexi bacterium]|nr:hypothetical protein [Chloroflexota bacterium]